MLCRFQQYLDKAIGLYPSVASCVQSFSSKLAFDLASPDRANRRVFIQALRDLSDDLKGHMAYGNTQSASFTFAYLV